jgi:SAM-dependent methyltransferase
MVPGLERIEPLFRFKGGTVSIEEFQQNINVIYHDVESGVYDKVHRACRVDLPREYDRLIDAAGMASGRGGLRLLDAGCGTGLATTLLLRSAVGPRVSHVVLLDTSKKMIDSTLAQARSWPVKAEARLGGLDDLDEAGAFDLVITSSVLHHIPDVAGFLERVGAILSPGGIYLQVHEPHSAALAGEVLRGRIRELESALEEHATRPSSRVARIFRGCHRRVRWRVSQLLGTGDYLGRVNAQLLARGVVRAPLTDKEIWSVTDIHDHAEGGISTAELAGKLTGCRLLAWHTYAFFGKLRSQLPEGFRRGEDRLAAEGDRDGLKIASAWIREP